MSPLHSISRARPLATSAASSAVIGDGRCAISAYLRKSRSTSSWTSGPCDVAQAERKAAIFTKIISRVLLDIPKFMFAANYSIIFYNITGDGKASNSSDTMALHLRLMRCALTEPSLVCSSELIAVLAEWLR